MTFKDQERPRDGVHKIISCENKVARVENIFAANMINY